MKFKINPLWRSLVAVALVLSMGLMVAAVPVSAAPTPIVTINSPTNAAHVYYVPPGRSASTTRLIPAQQMGIVDMRISIEKGTSILGQTGYFQVNTGATGVNPVGNPYTTTYNVSVTGSTQGKYDVVIDYRYPGGSGDYTTISQVDAVWFDTVARE